ncbi:hypothetical protein lerEdw1_014459 [Lerista edwardsae]|nr:hypothetical protein lerEdw1_014459 [Lerista edwardsae]
MWKSFRSRCLHQPLAASDRKSPGLPAHLPARRSRDPSASRLQQAPHPVARTPLPPAPHRPSAGRPGTAALCSTAAPRLAWPPPRGPGAQPASLPSPTKDVAPALAELLAWLSEASGGWLRARGGGPDAAAALWLSSPPKCPGWSISTLTPLVVDLRPHSGGKRDRPADPTPPPPLASSVEQTAAAVANGPADRQSLEVELPASLLRATRPQEGCLEKRSGADVGSGAWRV